MGYRLGPPPSKETRSFGRNAQGHILPFSPPAPFCGSADPPARRAGPRRLPLYFYLLRGAGPAAGEPGSRSPRLPGHATQICATTARRAKNPPK